MNKVLCCGSRTFSNIQMVVDVLSLLPQDTIIVEGGARGADRLSKLVGEALGLTIEEYPANWNKGRGAGMDRNTKMLEQGISKVIVFKDKKESAGTNDTIFKVGVFGIHCDVYNDF